MMSRTSRKFPSVLASCAVSLVGYDIARDDAQRSLLRWVVIASLALAAVTFASSMRAPLALGAVDTCLNAELRKGVAAQLPDCRAYEQVSPVDKNGFDVGKLDAFDVGGPVALDGNAAAFESAGAFAGATWGGAASMPYLATRGADGWSTRALMPRPADPGRTASIAAFSPDLRSSVLSAGSALTADPADLYSYYLRDNITGGIRQLATSPSSSQGEAYSRDVQHTVFDTQAVLTGEPDQPGDTIRKVYEAYPGGLRLVARRPGDDAPFQTASFLGSGFDPISTASAVSDDGRHIFFTTPQTGDERMIYRRSDGEATAVASPSERTSPDPLGPRAKVFHVATSGGDRVLFTSAEKLTDDANDGSFSGDLYRYDFDDHELVDLSAATPGLAEAEVRGVAGLSDSGDRVYYVANGQVVPGQGVSGEPNLYLWEDDGSPQGVTRFVATLDPADDRTWEWEQQKLAQATSDGQHLVFQSVASLTEYDTGGTSQVYLYDAQANGGAGRLTCVSCEVGTGPAAGASRLPLNALNLRALDDDYPRAISTDGSRILFSSLNPLLGRDTNGRYDAYMWQDGVVHLLSSGRSPKESFAFATSVSGDDMFFHTREALVLADGDTSIDLYTAHVGGGFASQQDAAAPSCDGDLCQGPPASAPVFAGSLSTWSGSAGNVRTVPDCRRFSNAASRLARHSRRLRRAANRTTGRRHRQLRRRSIGMAKRAKRQRAKNARCRQRALGDSR